MHEIPIPGLYGFQKKTIHSLLLTHIKINDEETYDIDYITVSPGGESVLDALKQYLRTVSICHRIVLVH